MSIAKQWNKIAKERLRDRLKGNDISYNTIFVPTIINRLKIEVNKSNTILDFGCGTGELTYEIAKLNFQTIGLDISDYCISLARSVFKYPTLTFYNNYLSELNYKEYFDIIVANMSLMDTEDIDSNFKEIGKALKPLGRILIIITHPCFWPIYWDYYRDAGFSYDKETKITKTYKTQKTVFSGFETSHYHRPISQYIELFSKNNFDIIDIKELKGQSENTWYPRFLYFEIEKR